jgi:hypothetical protein
MYERVRLGWHGMSWHVAARGSEGGWIEGAQRTNDTQR